MLLVIYLKCNTAFYFPPAKGFYISGAFHNRQYFLNLTRQIGNNYFALSTKKFTYSSWATIQSIF